MIRVDAHHHIWRIARGDYGWLSPDLPICRDYTLDDLRPLLGDISATVLVQAADTAAETEFLLETARQSGGLVRGVVGWTDLTHPDAPGRIAALASVSLLKGIRPMLQDIADTGWVLRPAVQPALKSLAASGLRFDALVQPRHLPILLQLHSLHPTLQLVIDHGAKPDIAGGAWQPWANDISRVASETPARCKLSGLVTEAGQHWSIDDLRRYTDHLIEAFGADRLMWGSDWPVVDMAGGYARWREASEALLAGISEPDRAAIFGDTALNFYGLMGY
jgi:L-fuconolactonase